MVILTCTLVKRMYLILLLIFLWIFHYFLLYLYDWKIKGGASCSFGVLRTKEENHFTIVNYRSIDIVHIICRDGVS